MTAASLTARVTLAGVRPLGTMESMHYPIAIEPGDAKHAYGVVVPDLPGCFSAGDTLDEAIANAPEAIALWLAETVERGEVAPAARPIETHRENPEFAGWIWQCSAAQRREVGTICSDAVS